MLYNIDIEELRKELENYYAAVAFSGFGAAFMDMSDVMRADADTLVRMAQENNIDITKFIIE